MHMFGSSQLANKDKKETFFWTFHSFQSNNIHLTVYSYTDEVEK
jgi:hypothetical protein